MPNATTRPRPLEFINGQPAALLWSQEDEIDFREADMLALPVLDPRVYLNMIRNYHMISTLLTGAARALLLRLQNSSILSNHDDDVDLYFKTLLSGEF